MTDIVVTATDLEQMFPGNIRAQMIFRQTVESLKAATNGVTLGVAATEGISEATVITLSPNDAFGNERVLALDPATLTATDGGPGGQLIIGLLNPIGNPSGFVLQFNTKGDSYLPVPTAWTDLVNAANDAAAATAGVDVGELYRNGSVVMVRMV